MVLMANTLYCDDDTITIIRNIAEREQMRMSDILREAVIAYISLMDDYEHVDKKDFLIMKRK